MSKCRKGSVRMYSANGTVDVECGVRGLVRYTPVACRGVE